MSAGKYDTMATAAPVATATPLVEVQAPATLSAGYTFDASYEGRVFKVEVPPGGVKEGQRFAVSLPPDAAPLVGGDARAPKYQWKDGMCDCFRFGCFHPSLLNACFCPQLLMAQVATRMKLDWLGRSAGPESEEYRNTFCKVATLVVFYYLIRTALAPFKPDVDFDEEGNVVEDEDGPDVPLWVQIVDNAVGTAFGLYTLIVMIKVRRSIREKYSIQPQRCGACEDCCAVFWCGCCTVAQMARHTADYNERRAVCCSSTGLPDTPELQPAMIV
mmetsp:Transcript_26516/g.57478  ORF Transcript_26516/g.57478 Transcript_26516/m.57478 type:complete len:273 (-) Transcript_26516:127-945(-)